MYEDNLPPGVTLGMIDMAAGVDDGPDPEAGWWYDDEWGCWRLDDDDDDELDEDGDGGSGPEAA